MNANDLTDFCFEKAIRRRTAAIIGLAGPSGGGKTWTALELATGLATGGKIALISTEGNRDLYYADHFDFDRVGLEAPYEPKRCLAAMQAAQSAGYAVIIFDSFSDEYIGEGGLVDMAAAEKTPNEAAKWARPKAEHKRVIRWIRNSARCHLIFAMRAEEKVKLVKVIKDGREQTVVEPIGFQPICEKAFMFDMMESALLLPELRDKEGKIILSDARGVPQWIKPMSQHLVFFPANKPITRQCGRQVAEWCAGGISIPVGGEVVSGETKRDTTRASSPPSNSKKAADGRYKQLRDMIDAGEEIAGSALWEECHAWYITAARESGDDEDRATERAATVMGTLLARIEQRRTAHNTP